MARSFKYYGSRPLKSPSGNSHWLLWAADDSRVFRVGVPHALSAPNSAFEIAKGSNVFEELPSFLERTFPSEGKWEITQMKLPPGGFYPRMARPSDQHPSDSPGACGGHSQLRAEIATLLGQLGSLVGQLERIFAVVQPVQANFGAYGHEIRNLLILACTEVEAQWRAVLVANGRTKNHFTTNDYVLLEPALKLGAYSVELPSQPWLKPVVPFAGWGSTGKPTQELPWYHSYNAVKHDRESNFERATLENVITSVAACWIMLNAQFGFHGRQKRPDVDRFFSLATRPAWDYSEVYTHPYGYLGTPKTESPVNYAF